MGSPTPDDLAAMARLLLALYEGNR